WYSLLPVRKVPKGAGYGPRSHGGGGGVVLAALRCDLPIDRRVETRVFGSFPLPVPSEDRTADGRDRIGGAPALVRGLVVQTQTTLQDVAEVDGPLGGGRIVGFDAQVAFGARQRFTEFGILVDEVEQILDEGAVAADETFDAVFVPAVLLRDPGLSAAQRPDPLRTEQRHGFRQRPTVLRIIAEGEVDGVLGH